VYKLAYSMEIVQSVQDLACNLLDKRYGNPAMSVLGLLQQLKEIHSQRLESIQIR
jgi:hypothetical protein